MLFEKNRNRNAEYALFNIKLFTKNKVIKPKLSACYFQIRYNTCMQTV